MNRAIGKALTAVAVAIGVSMLAQGATGARQGAASPDERVAAIKQALQRDRANIGKYEWLETTSVSLKGEEKSRKQQRCYYGADGKLQKVAVPSDAPPAAAPAGGGGGRRGGGRLKAKVVENKKEDMQGYMQAAVALVHQYVPPKPEDIDRAKQAGKLSVKPGESGLARVAFADYLKPGDVLALDVDAAANRLAGIHVTSYLEQKDDVVDFTVRFGRLADDTGYAEETTLDAPAKKIRVVIQNSGHRPMQP